MDDRGRVALPARYRDMLGSSVVLSQGPDGCLEVYAPDEYARRAEELTAGSTGRQRDRRCTEIKRDARIASLRTGTKTLAMKTISASGHMPCVRK